jgi:hypothetical protein
VESEEQDSSMSADHGKGTDDYIETAEYWDTLRALEEALDDLQNGEMLTVEEAFAQIRGMHHLPNAAKRR